MFTSVFKKTLNAPVYDVAIETPIDEMKLLGASLNNTVLIKREDLQPVFSFKLRGAYCKIATLSDAEKEQGIIAASAGNHAQGVALSAAKTNIRSIIVMPLTTPAIKVNAVRAHGSEVVLFGDTFDEAFCRAEEIAKEKNLVFIHPYDDLDVIAGQGTIGMEILRQHSGKLDAIFIPVGGGGLIAGVAAYIKSLRPDIKIIGVEHDESACLHAAIAANGRVTLTNIGIFADGIAVKKIGKLPFEIVKDLIDDIVIVSTDEICAAIKDIFIDTRSISEPAGASGLAGLKKYAAANNLKDQTLMTIETGANLNFDSLQHISLRCELGEHREVLFGLIIPEKKGSFKDLCEIVSEFNISEFNYRFSDPINARVFVGLILKSDLASRKEIIERLKAKNFQVCDLTDDEMSKLHLRRMIGGFNPNIKNESFYMVQFPERCAALLELLNLIGERWNISMFQYQNIGSAYGRVFLGLQISQSDKSSFEQILNDLGYSFSEETDNPACALFLS